MPLLKLLIIFFWDIEIVLTQVWAVQNCTDNSLLPGSSIKIVYVEGSKLKYWHCWGQWQFTLNSIIFAIPKYKQPTGNFQLQ